MSIQPHTHKQDTPSDTWTISHGLGCNPTVSVRIMYEGVLTGILPLNISFPNITTVVITFSQPRSGEARLA